MAVRIKKSNEWGSVAPGQVRFAWIVYGVDGDSMGHLYTFMGVFLEPDRAQAEKLVTSRFVSIAKCEVIGTSDGGVRILGRNSSIVHETVALGPVDQKEKLRLRTLAKLSNEERQALGLE